MHTRGAVQCDLRKGEENAWQSRERHWAVTESWIPTFSVFSVYSPCIRRQGNKSYSVPHVQVHLSGCNTSLLILRISFGMTFLCSSWNEVLLYYTLPIPHTPVWMHVSLSKTMGLRISFHFPLNETKRPIRKKSAYLWHTRAESISKLQKPGWPPPLCPPLTQFTGCVLFSLGVTLSEWSLWYLQDGDSCEVPETDHGFQFFLIFVFLFLRFSTPAFIKTLSFQ